MATPYRLVRLMKDSLSVVRQRTFAEKWQNILQNIKTSYCKQLLVVWNRCLTLLR